MKNLINKVICMCRYVEAPFYYHDFLLPWKNHDGLGIQNPNVGGAHFLPCLCTTVVFKKIIGRGGEGGGPHVILEFSCLSFEPAA